MKKTISYLFITALIPLLWAQQYANIGQQYANGGLQYANNGQQFAQNQYKFWRPQFDHGGQYQSQPRFQPQQQQYQQPPQQYQPQQFQAPPQQQFQPQPQQVQQQQQQYQAPQQFYQPQIQQQVQQVQQFQPQFQQQAYQQQPSPQQQQQQYQAPQQQQFVPPQPRQPVYQQPQFNQAPPQQQQVYQQQPQVVQQQQAPPPPPVNQAPPQQQFQQPYPQHVYREQPQLFQQQQKQPYPQQQFVQQPVNRPPPQIYQHEFTVSQPAPPPPAPTVYQPPPAPTTPAPPPPPERFFPHISDLYTGPTGSSPNGYHIDAPVTIIETEKNEGPYVAEEIIVDGHHPSYIENTERMQPPPPPTISHNRPQPRFVPQEPILKQPNLPVASFDRPKQLNRPQPAQVAPLRPPQPPPVQQTRIQPKPAVTLARQPEPVEAPASSLKAPSPVGTKARASEVFLGCCQKRKVVKACERICSFDVLNKKTLTGMFLGTDPCPQSHGLDLLQCAAQSEDHTECCKDMGVHTTSAGNKCLGFCNMKPGVTFQADVSMLPCWGVLNDIKTCFKQYIEDHKL